MDVEIVEFYPRKSRTPGVITGTLHVYWCCEDLDIRGCGVYVKKGKIHITLPYMKQFDAEQNKVVSFPVLNYLNEEKQKGLQQAVITKGREFIKKYLEKKR